MAKRKGHHEGQNMFWSRGSKPARLFAPLSNGVSGITTDLLVDVGSSGFGKGEFFDC